MTDPSDPPTGPLPDPPTGPLPDPPTLPLPDPPTLAAERTALAHWRTQLVVALAVVLVVRQATPGVERLVATLAAVAGGTLVWVVTLGRERALRALGSSPDIRALGRHGLALVAGVALLQAAALVVIV